MRTRVIRNVLLSVIPAALLIAGCSDEGGTPSATDSARPSTPASQSTSPAGGTGLAGLTACDMFTADELQQLEANGPGEDSGAIGGSDTSGCDWQTAYGDERGVTFGITIRPSQGVSTVVVKEGWTKQNGKFEGRDAVILKQQREAGASCTIALAVGANGRVDVGATGGGEVEKMCEFTNKIATIVEPKLPKDGG